MQFKKVIANAALKQQLLEQVYGNRVSHAQMFEEKEGNGALALALAYAQYINCLDPTKDDSCAQCSSCIKFEKLQHPDLHFIFPTATNQTITKNPSSAQYLTEWKETLLANPYMSLSHWSETMHIDNKQPIINVRDSQEIITKLSLRAYEAIKKTIVIWLPEKMNLETSNKLLKTMEEPDVNTVLLLVTQDVDALLPTILSRVQLIKVPKPKHEEIAKGLQEVLYIPKENAESAALLCDGNIHVAIDITANNEVEDFYITNFQNWMRYCYTANILDISAWVEAIAIAGREQQKILAEYGLRFFRECLVNNYGNGLNNLHEKERAFLEKFSPFIHGGNIVLISEAFEELHQHISRNANPKITFMNLSIHVSKLLKLKAEV